MVNKKSDNAIQTTTNQNHQTNQLLVDETKEPPVSSLLNSNKSISMIKEQSDLLAKGVI